MSDLALWISYAGYRRLYLWYFGGDGPLLQPPVVGNVLLIGLVLDACFVYKQFRYLYEHSKLVAELRVGVRLSGRSWSTVSGKQNVHFLYEEKHLLQEVTIFVSGYRNTTDTGLEICSLSLRFCFLKHLCYPTEPVRTKILWQFA